MASKIIENIKYLQQFMEDGSMLLPDMPTVFRLVQSLNAPEYMNYDYIMSISGAAVRLSWQQGWAAYEKEPNQGNLFINGDRLTEFNNVFSRLGISYSTHFIKGKESEWDGCYTGEVEWSTTDEARVKIIQSINRGAPVIINGPYASTLVVGYEDDGAILWGVAVFASPEERQSPYNYVKIIDWDQKIKGYYIINEFSPRDMDKDLLNEILKTAVSLARTARIDKLGDTALGISAFDSLAEQLVWDESFEPLVPGKKFEGKVIFPYDRPDGYYREDGAKTLGDRFWAGYCDFLCMLNGYSNFSRFLVKQAENNIVPEWSDKLKQAAEYYNAACDYSGKLWEYVSPNEEGVAKFKTSEVRYTFAAHMLRAKIYTIKAIEILEKLK